MDQTSGKDLLTVRVHTDGESTLETVITEVCKSLSQHGIPIEMVNLHRIPITQDGRIKLELRVEFARDKDGTLGPVADTTQESSHAHKLDEDGRCLYIAITGCNDFP